MSNLNPKLQNKSLPTGQMPTKNDSTAPRKFFSMAAIGMALCATSMICGKVPRPNNPNPIDHNPSSMFTSDTHTMSWAESPSVESGSTTQSSKKRKHRGLILGGESASKEDNYEFFAHFDGEDSNCGGSLIAPNVILTAGHCWRMNMPDPWIGPLYETKDTERKIGRVAEHRIHPDYALSSKYYNDFLLIRLSSIETEEWEADTDDDIPISLPWLDGWEDRRRRTSQNENENKRLRARSNNIIENDGRNLADTDGFSYIRLNPDPITPVDYTPLSVIGMGFDEDNENSDTLQHITGDSTFQKLPTSLCNQRDSYNGEISEENMLCAGTMEGAKDSCLGDSGGPLFYYENDEGNEIPVQVGVVSWGKGCGLPNRPGIYSRVSSAYEWIRDVVCGDWKDTIISANATPDSTSNNDDWFLCQGYDDEKPRNQTGGIFSIGETTSNASVDIVCNETSEVLLEFHLTADAYGTDTYWELLSENSEEGWEEPNRIFGDQLFNDHETRLYSFCLPRPKKDDVMDNESEETFLEWHSNATDSNMTDSNFTVSDVADTERSYETPIDEDYCYILNIHDHVKDGLTANISKTEENASNDPAGFAIRLGTAEAYEDFGFPDFGGIATFALCPAPVIGGESNIDNEREDMIIVVTEAPSQQPSEAPSYQPSERPTSLPSASPSFSVTEALSDVPTASSSSYPTDAITEVSTASQTANPVGEVILQPEDTPEVGLGLGWP